MTDVLPRDWFVTTWRGLGATGEGEAAFSLLSAGYAEKARAYHSARHIVACLTLAREAPFRAAASFPHEVDAALWFHDVVYDTHAPDNEERSAALAASSLEAAGVDADVIARVVAHVLSTKHHRAESSDGALVIDIDLSILGADEETFARFEDEIRREYAWVEAAVYATGRAQVLRRFLARPQIYQTAEACRRFEARARTNLARAVAHLEGAAPGPVVRE